MAESFKELQAECNSEKVNHPGLILKRNGEHRTLRVSPANANAKQRLKDIAARVARRCGVTSDALAFCFELMANWAGMEESKYRPLHPRLYVTEGQRMEMSRSGDSLSEVRAKRGEGPDPFNDALVKVSTKVTAVTWVQEHERDGRVKRTPQFPTSKPSITALWIEGEKYHIASVDSPTSLTLMESAGDHDGVFARVGLAIEALPLIEHGEIPDVFTELGLACSRLHSLEETEKLPTNLAESAVERDQELITARKGIKRGIQSQYVDREPVVIPAHLKDWAESRVAEIREDLERRREQGETISAKELEAWEALIRFTLAQAEDKPVTREPNTTKRRLRLIADALGFYFGALARKGMLSLERLRDHEALADLLVEWELCPFDFRKDLPEENPNEWFRFGGNYFHKRYLRIVIWWLDERGPDAYQHPNTRNPEAELKDRAFGVIDEIKQPVSLRWQEGASATEQSQKARALDAARRGTLEARRTRYFALLAEWQKVKITPIDPKLQELEGRFNALSLPADFHFIVDFLGGCESQDKFGIGLKFDSLAADAGETLGTSVGVTRTTGREWADFWKFCVWFYLREDGRRGESSPYDEADEAGGGWVGGIVRPHGNPMRNSPVALSTDLVLWLKQEAGVARATQSPDATPMQTLEASALNGSEGTVERTQAQAEPEATRGEDEHAGLKSKRREQAEAFLGRVNVHLRSHPETALEKNKVHKTDISRVAGYSDHTAYKDWEKLDSEIKGGSAPDNNIATVLRMSLVDFIKAVILKRSKKIS